MVLLLTLVLAIFIGVSHIFRSEQIFARLVSSPWDNLAGMIQNGVWSPAEDSQGSHPLTYGRWITPVHEEGILRGD